jgi:hypothetical protein
MADNPLHPPLNRRVGPRPPTCWDAFNGRGFIPIAHTGFVEVLKLAPQNLGPEECSSAACDTPGRQVEWQIGECVILFRGKAVTDDEYNPKVFSNALLAIAEADRITSRAPKWSYFPIDAYGRIEEKGPITIVFKPDYRITVAEQHPDCLTVHHSPYTLWYTAPGDARRCLATGKHGTAPLRFRTQMLAEQAAADAISGKRPLRCLPFQ